MELKFDINPFLEASATLLIVPYGIEIFLITILFLTIGLLIVPYGIEM